MQKKKNKLFYIIISTLIITSIIIYLILNKKEKLNTNIIDNNVEATSDIIDENDEEFIEDSELYNYKNPVVPEGFRTVETTIASWKLDESGNPIGWNNGLVIEDNDGNQFVWIPVKDVQNLKRIDGYWSRNKQNYVNDCKEADNISSTVESKEMYRSIKKYKGFYIARYEAGIEDQVKRYVQDGTIKPLSKQNVYVWSHICWGSAYGYALDGVQGSDLEDGAVKVARSMYPNTEKLQTYKLPSELTNTTGVISTLCYGIQWDLAMDFISDIENPYTNTKYIEDSTSMGWFGPNSKSKEQLTGKSVDKNNSNCVKNIYDLAGNVYEWTMESYKDKYRIYRGGMYEMGNSDISASTRAHCIPNEKYSFTGFRVTLYLK